MTAAEFIERDRADKAQAEARHWNDQLRFSEEARVRLAGRLEAMQVRCAAVETDNARLRELIQRAERNGPPGINCNQCPWCPADTTSNDRRHFSYCPAFTPDGQVR